MLTEMDEPGLQELFRRLNENLFQGRLRADVHWSSRLRRSAGNCCPARHLIRLSRRYHEAYPDQLPLTLLHEMIHLLHPGHGPAFRREALRVMGAVGVTDYRQFRYARPLPAGAGGGPERRGAAPLRRREYVYACPGCGRLFHARGRWRRRRSCGICHPGGFDARFELRRVSGPAGVPVQGPLPGLPPAAARPVTDGGKGRQAPPQRRQQR
ncbi:MAG: SprT-like domain-containing protein [Firmicutes bacterium]|nr:SprT-like domain-containing protein [Bacillota bacterium]